MSNQKATSSPLGVLVFSATAQGSYRHESIPAGVAAFQRLAANSEGGRPLAVTASEDPSLFAPASLGRFAVIVLLHVAGDVFSPEQLDALKGFVHNGGGVVGVHAATTAMRGDPSGWYARMLGARFAQHPIPQWGLIKISDARHDIVAASLGASEGMAKQDASDEHVAAWTWRWFDEWYNFTAQPKAAADAHVLLAVDETSYEGGTHGEDHPIAWCQEFEGGRTFYTALGHFDAAYEDDAFMGQVLNGILWTARAIE